MTRIEIRIDELVLRGVPQEYAGVIAARVEEHLTELARRHVADHGVEGIASSRLDAVAPRPARAPAEGVGALAADVARQVWGAAVGPIGGKP